MKEVTQQLIQRQHDIEAGEFRRILVNAEGMTTNGRFLLPFKLGAFLSLLPVEPIFQQLDCAGPDTYMTSLRIFSVLVFSMCGLYNNHTAYLFPQFIPNEYLFEKHADKGKTKAEIYAWAVRDVMAKYMEVEKIDVQDPLGKALSYYQQLGFKAPKRKQT